MDFPEDINYKKTLSFRAWKQEILFRVSQDLFSSFDVDKGTRLLLRTIVDARYEYSSVLDMGCGYGPLGLTLKKLRPETELTMVDRDALAVDYARQNAALNGIDAQIHGSLGYDDLPLAEYSLIVVNIPGKAGPGVISYLVQEARYYLNPYGVVAVVVVNPIAGFVRQVLEASEDVEIVHETTRSAHTVFHYHFPGPMQERSALSSFDRGIYDRADITIQRGTVTYTIKTVYGLPEFDSLHYATELLMDALAGAGIRVGSEVAFLNPGQGHAPVNFCKTLKPEQVSLIDRDLLALRTTRRNLILNGCPEDNIEVIHQARFAIDKPVDIIAGVINESEGQRVYLKLLEGAVAGLKTGGLYIAAGSSTAVTRLATHVEENKLKAVVRERKKSKGYSSLVLQKM